MIIPVIVAISLRSFSVISSRMPVFSGLNSANEYPSSCGEGSLSREFTLFVVGAAVVATLRSGNGKATVPCFNCLGFFVSNGGAGLDTVIPATLAFIGASGDGGMVVPTLPLMAFEASCTVSVYVTVSLA